MIKNRFKLFEEEFNELIKLQIEKKDKELARRLFIFSCGLMGFTSILDSPLTKEEEETIKRIEKINNDLQKE